MKLQYPKIIVVDGISGSGKSTAAKVIAAQLNGKLIHGDLLLFKYIKEKYSIGDMSGVEYFLKHFFYEPEQYSELQTQALPYMEENIYYEIQRLRKLRIKPKAIVVDAAASSTIYPWQSEEETKKILVEMPDEEKRRRIIIAREPNVTEQVAIILKDTQLKLIQPQKANILVRNIDDTKELFEERVRREVCEII